MKVIIELSLDTTEKNYQNKHDQLMELAREAKAKLTFDFSESKEETDEDGEDEDEDDPHTIFIKHLKALANEHANYPFFRPPKAGPEYPNFAEIK